MAHDCPDCGQACYCDGDDTWIDLWATDGDCDHECGDDEWPDDDWDATPDDEAPRGEGTDAGDTKGRE